MNLSFLTTLYRSVTRHRLSAALNVGGLALGIAVFLVLGLYVQFETSFERWLPGHDRVYVVQTVWNLPGNASNGAYPFTMGGLLEEFRDDFPDLVGTRVSGGEKAGSVVHDGVATSEDVAKVDPSFFQVIDLPMAAGDGPSALRSPANVLISESVARRYFGVQNPLGRSLTVNFDGTGSYRVAGVFKDIPRNSDLKLGVISTLPRTSTAENWYHWGSSSVQTFLRFGSPADAEAFDMKMKAFVERHGRRDLGSDPWNVQQLTLLPLDRMHLEPQGGQSASRKITVGGLGAVGALTLLIAMVNYVNLATARAGLRAREVAMRKVLGADRWTLVRQFLAEAMLTMVVATVMGIALTELSLPVTNASLGLDLSIPYGLVMPAMAILVLLVGTVAGIYPALLMSNFPAVAVLASARAPGGGRAGAATREALVLVQFGLATAFIIATAVLVAQTVHVRSTDLGFEREGLLIVRSLRDDAVLPDQRRAFATAAKAVPGVVSVALANGAVGGSGEDNSDNVPLPGVAGPGPSLRWMITGPGFFKTYGSRLLAGRTFDDAHGGDDSHGAKDGLPRNIVVNSRAVPALGFRSAGEAVGKTVGGSSPRTIVGVVGDMRFSSPREPIGPAYYLYYRNPESAGSVVATIRFSGAPMAVSDALKTVWQRYVPNIPFDGATADGRLAEFYAADDRATRLFGIGAVLAVVIGCIGLSGLASFYTARRVKEIGIRKTLGASSGDIVFKLTGQFLRPVLAANVIAWPIAFAAMRIWLAGFDDRIALSPLFFVGASCLAVIIAAATVMAQSVRASRAAPAWALRHE